MTNSEDIHPVNIIPQYHLSNLDSKTISELPYILVPSSKLRILIDTGSTKSYINPIIAEHFFQNKFQSEPFEVRTAHGSSQGQFTTLVPCGEFFKQRNLKLKFNVFQFHKKFDLLLGIDCLKILKASVDLNKNVLRTPKIEIPLNYLNTNEAELHLIDSRTVQQVKIRVKNIENGDAVLPYMRIGNLEVPESLVRVKNFETNIKILNPDEKVAKFTQITPIEVEEIGEIPSPEKLETLNNFYEENFDFKFDTSKLRLDHMNEEEKSGILNLVNKYSDIFHQEDEPLSFTHHVKHKIRTTDEVPIYARNYRFPEIYRQEVDRQVEEMLAQGIVKHSDSPWNAPIWIVPKKADASGKPKFRVVIDYRKLNEKTHEDRYPLPQISELLDKLGRCQYFSVIDLKSGFHQIEVDPDSRAKTAFSTPNYHLEFTRLPFGLKNSPATFQRLMDNILRGIANEFCCVYLDDIIIFSVSLAEHLARLEEVFKRLRKANLKIQLDKTEFLRTEVAYLGHVITPEGVKPNPDKIKAIMNYPIPSTTTEIKSFLGLLGYYRKFIRDFAKITKPMTMCLRKGSKIDINCPYYRECFTKCQTLLTNEPILQYPDFQKPFRLTCDASNIAVGCVLSQVTNGADLPVAYASRTLNDTERRLSTIERELLAIVWGVQYFRPYLFGRKFKILSDHKPLQWLSSIKEPSSKLFKWRTRLSAYDFDIEYKKGQLNTNADALSRVELLNNLDEETDQRSPVNDPDYEPTSDEIEAALDECVAGLTPNTRKILDEMDIGSLAVQPDSETRSVIADFDSDDGDSNPTSTVHSDAIGHAIVAIPIKDDPVNVCKNQILIEIVRTPTDQPVEILKLFNDKNRMIVQLSETHLERDVIKFVKEHVQPKIKYGVYFAENIYPEFVAIMTKNFTFSEISMTKYTKLLKDILEENERKAIIQKHHEGVTNHRGIDECHLRLKRDFYWPNMRETIQKYINNCEICVKCKYDRMPIKVKYNVTPTASRPLETLHIDTMTLDGSKFLTLVDSFSRYAQAYPLKSANAIDVIEALLQYFKHHGTPTNIVTDNGPEFQNSLFREFMLLHRVLVHYTASQHPESNSIVERFHSTLVEHFRILSLRPEYKKSPSKTKVDYAIVAYNNSIHSASKLTPFELLYGHIKQPTLLEFDADQILTNNYLDSHRERMKIVYSQMQKKFLEDKTKIIEKLNEKREETPPIPPEVYVKTVQKQSKTKPKFNKEIIKTVNPELKTANIIPRHHNTREKIHLVNVRRPKKFAEATSSAWDEKLNKSEILVEKFGLKITREDLLSLKGKNWLNDQVINFYMELIDQRSRGNNKFPKTHSFNVYLFQSFESRGFERVRNYTRKTDIFSKDIIIIPIFKEAHWRLVIVKIPSKEIIYFDSLNLDHTNILDTVQSYLKQEYQAKKNKTLNLDDWKIYKYPETPQQSNCFDCGAYSCQIANLVAINEPIIIPAEDVPSLREKICYEILKSELI